MVFITDMRYYFPLTSLSKLNNYQRNFSSHLKQRHGKVFTSKLIKKYSQYIKFQLREGPASIRLGFAKKFSLCLFFCFQEKSTSQQKVKLVNKII